MNQSKKNILFIFGVTDNLFESDKRNPGRGYQLAVDLRDFLGKFHNKYDAFVTINSGGESNSLFDVSSMKDKMARVLDVQLGTGELIHYRNKLTINESDMSDKYITDSTYLEDFFDSEKYNVFIAGIDINNIVAPSVDQLTDKGYSVVSIGSLLLPFSKESLDQIKQKTSVFPYNRKSA